MSTTAWASGDTAWLSSSSIARMAAALYRGQDQGDAGVALRADGAEQVDRLVAGRARRADACPSGTTVGRCDRSGRPGLVEKPDLEPFGLGMVAGDFGDQAGEFFLSAGP